MTKLTGLKTSDIRFSQPNLDGRDRTDEEEKVQTDKGGGKDGDARGGGGGGEAPAEAEAEALAADLAAAAALVAAANRAAVLDAVLRDVDGSIDGSRDGSRDRGEGGDARGDGARGGGGAFDGREGGGIGPRRGRKPSTDTKLTEELKEVLLELKVGTQNDPNNIITSFTHILNFDNNLDDKLNQIMSNESFKPTLLNFLKESNEQTANYLREYILNKYDNPFDDNLKDLEDLKEASAIGVLKHYNATESQIKHTYETCKQAVDILCEPNDGTFSGYVFKDQYKHQNKFELDRGLKDFTNHEEIIYTAQSEPFKTLRNVERFLQPFFPPASSALSSLGSLLLDKNKESIQIQSLNFRPPNRTTSKVVEDINISAGSLANSRGKPITR